MVSPYLLRPLRTIEEALRDIKKSREYWEWPSGTVLPLETARGASDAADATAPARPGRNDT